MTRRAQRAHVGALAPPAVHLPSPAPAGRGGHKPLGDTASWTRAAAPWSDLAGGAGPETVLGSSHSTHGQSFLRCNAPVRGEWLWLSSASDQCVPVLKAAHLYAGGFGIATQLPVEPTLKPEAHVLQAWALLHLRQFALPVRHL